MSDFDSCQSNRTHTDGLQNWKASQVVQDLWWHLTSAYMKGMYGWAGVRYVITKFSRMDSLPKFVAHGAPLRALRAGAPLWRKLVPCQSQKKVGCLTSSHYTQTTGSASSKYELLRTSALLPNIRNIGICMGEKSLTKKHIWQWQAKNIPQVALSKQLAKQKFKSLDD